MIEGALRWTAVAVATLAFLDPPVTVSGRVRPRVAIAIQRGPSMQLPASSGRDSRTAAARRAVGTLRSSLAGDFEFTNGVDRSANALVVIGDRYPEDPFDFAGPVATVSVGSSVTPNVAITGVDAPRSIPAATMVRLTVDVAAAAMKGTVSVLMLHCAGAEVGRATHAWTTDDETWRASIDAVPVGPAPFVFDASLDVLAAERTADDNHASIAVDAAPRLRIFVLESRPSWATAFVRRALENDSRFEVSGVSAASPRAIVRSGQAPSRPDDPRLFDAVIAGGFDRASEAELAFLDRFARERGGAVVLIPDAAVPAAVSRRLLPDIVFRETLLERAAPLAVAGAPAFEASELLEASGLPSTSDVIARAAGSQRAIVWSMPHGDGRVFLSGAMDAWRYRGSGEDGTAPFDRFWRGVVAGAALAAMPAVDVALMPRRAASGEQVRVVARVRGSERMERGDALAISARAGTLPIRLWPEAETGLFSGSFIVDPAQGRETQRVEVSLGNGTAGSARMSVDESARARTGIPLAWLSATRNGADADPSNLSQVADYLRRTVTAPAAPQRRQPMRSAWWFAPFALCLTAEWWLRRRRGAR